MLSEEERREIEAELAEAGTKRSVCLEAMKILQRHRGWLADESREDLTGILGMSVTELDSVATFYNLLFRRRVGEHLILVCDSVSCWIMGGDRVVDHLRERLGIGLGETTPDGRFTLLTIPCLGACDRAPAMMVDQELHGPLTPEEIDRVLDRWGESHG